MTQDKFNEMLAVYLSDKEKEMPATWSKEARAWCEQNGIINGDDKGNKKYKSFVTREEFAQILYNLHNKKMI